MKIQFRVATMEGALRVNLAPGEAALFGRQPDAGRLPHDLAQLRPKVVTVPSEHVSANHVFVLVHGGRASVVDLQSRNGTTIRHVGETVVLEVSPSGISEPASRPSLPIEPVWQSREDFARCVHAAVERWLREVGVDADAALVADDVAAHGGHRLATGERLVLTLRAGTLDLRIADDLAAVARFVAEQNERFGEEHVHEPGVVFRSRAIRVAHHEVCEAARHGRSLLLYGPTGSGKERLAGCYHAHSGRSDRRFVPVNCGAIPENLLENEFFGSVPGAWSGATQKAGLFEEADGGTLFLDEVGELPLTAQVKLLRVLDDRKVRRLGDHRLRSVDVQLVYATHRDLRAMVAAGTFREDLWYRIASSRVVNVPALCDRQEDVEGYLRTATLRDGRYAWDALTVDTQALLLQHPWRGNFRELRAFVIQLTDVPPGLVDISRCRTMLDGTLWKQGATSNATATAPKAEASDDEMWAAVEARAWSMWSREHPRRPASFHELISFVDEYLKPLFVAMVGGVASGVALPERVQVNAVARRLGIDWNTADKWLRRYWKRWGSGD